MDKWRNYALKSGKIKKNYQRQYSNRNSVGLPKKASYCDRILESGQEQSEIEKEIMEAMYGQGQIRIGGAFQSSGTPSGEIRCGESCGSSSSSGYQEVRCEENGSNGESRKEEVGNDETIREEVSLEAHQEGRQRVPRSNRGRRKAQETDSQIQAGEEEVKEKMTPKEKKHEAKESKAYEKKEDRREAKKEAPKKKK